jgi:hypothetical protein
MPRLVVEDDGGVHGAVGVGAAIARTGLVQLGEIAEQVGNSTNWSHAQSTTIALLDFIPARLAVEVATTLVLYLLLRCYVAYTVQDIIRTHHRTIHKAKNL